MSKPAKVPPAKLARSVEWTRHHLLRLHQRLLPAPAAMMEMIVAGLPAQAITAAAELGIADALADGPLPIDELAARVGADADALRRLLRALIGRGIFRRRRDGRYALNSLADTLRSDAPISLRGAALFEGSQELRERWTLLADSVRTGESIVPALRGKEAWEYIAEIPELAELFNQTMTSLAQMTVAAVVASYDFGTYRTIVDVGGGQGCMLAAILRRRRIREASCTTCRASSRPPQTCCASTMSSTGCGSRKGHSSRVFRPVVTPTCSRTSSTTGPMTRHCRFCVMFARRPARGHSAAGRNGRSRKRPRLPRELGGSRDAAEPGLPRTQRGRVSETARSGWIPDDAGGADRLAAQCGRGCDRRHGRTGTRLTGSSDFASNSHALPNDRRMSNGYRDHASRRFRRLVAGSAATDRPPGIPGPRRRRRPHQAAGDSLARPDGPESCRITITSPRAP